jgi:dTDP-4-amino-4,6-dideoxygalactose transaminase
MSPSPWAVTLAEPVIGTEEVAAVSRVLLSGWLSAGPETAAFEAEFGTAIGAPAAAVSSGTAALHLALLALGVGPGDEVIVPSLTFVATASTVVLVGARPVFADVRAEDDLTIDPDDVARRLTTRTRAIVAVHYGGWPADVRALRKLADRAGVSLVEDVAHAPLVQTPEGMLGTVGDAGCFSFFATKNLTTGEGGLVVARDRQVIDRVRLLRSHAMTANTWDRHHGRASGYDVVDIGLNYRPTEVAAAIGRVQLGRLGADREVRAAVFARYCQRLASLPVTLAWPRSTRSAYHLLPILLPEGADREAVQARLADVGIQSSVHYPPIHLFSAYRLRFGTGDGDLPRTEGLAGRLLSLPMHARLTTGDVELVVDALAEALGSAVITGWRSRAV